MLDLICLYYFPLSFDSIYFCLNFNICKTISRKLKYKLNLPNLDRLEKLNERDIFLYIQSSNQVKYIFYNLREYGQIEKVLNPMSKNILFPAFKERN